MPCSCKCFDDMFMRTRKLFYNMCILQSCNMSCQAVANMLFTAAVMPQVFARNPPCPTLSVSASFALCKAWCMCLHIAGQRVARGPLTYLVSLRPGLASIGVCDYVHSDGGLGPVALSSPSQKAHPFLKFETLSKRSKN